VWFEALGQHGDNLQGFYRELLGWKFDRDRARVLPPPLPPRPRRGAVFPRRSRAPLAPPWWVTFYARVPDLGAAIEKAQALGSRVLVPPMRHGNTMIAVITDPEGHPIGLCT
jgi:predicted enzyme related to lactoylglutathione lyase